MYSFLADMVVISHFGFVLFAVLGGLLALRWPKAAWLHLPTAVWAALIEFGGWYCPLTTLENWLRVRAGEGSYGGGFVARHIFGVLYPEGLTYHMQVAIGVFVIAINLLIYWQVLRRRKARAPKPG